MFWVESYNTTELNIIMEQNIDRTEDTHLSAVTLLGPSSNLICAEESKKLDCAGFASFKNYPHSVTILTRSVYAGKCAPVALSAFLKTKSLDEPQKEPQRT